MPLYEFYKTGEGDQERTGLREVFLGHETKPKEIQTPSGVDLPGPVKIWTCLLCDDIKFKTPGLASRHFNSNHQDKKEGPESWRDYFEVLDVSESG